MKRKKCECLKSFQKPCSFTGQYITIEKGTYGYWYVEDYMRFVITKKGMADQVISMSELEEYFNYKKMIKNLVESN